MEEQRQRQEDEARRVTQESMHNIEHEQGLYEAIRSFDGICSYTGEQ